MSLVSPIRCACRRGAASISLPAPQSARRLTTLPPLRSFASTSTPPLPPPKPSSKTRYALAFLGLSLTLPASFYFFTSSSNSALSPQIYTDQKITATKSLTPQHKLIAVAVPPSSKQYFEKPYKVDGTLSDSYVGGTGVGEVVVQHMMIKSPDIQIERPYTPINDAVKDGEVRMVVKRVKGGEVGRVVHNAQPGGEVGIRGPIPTFSIVPGDYDKIIMISTGTAVAPFLQLLCKLPSSSSSSSSPQPALHLIQASPLPDRIDWSNTDTDPAFIPSLQAKFGSRLVVSRIEPGLVGKDVVKNALGGEKGEKVMVLVCLPPWLMRPLCGSMTPNLGQGPITGVLAELGLTNQQVWKLE
ncbi:hypothetical protein CI109_101854 [Kwoniella shandongensis]|uniref:Uncharacterized protein n=1 Tax=Kwoniella shandongensis TaxID=1734106 RepID=A0A5M6BP31_9TREE|nr:uncharacterized protein CI109_007034 [Kwoniella shandongensis]KAA5524648.1 hypothetical protein CI109_007034 [Kwoniella shandongensis]